MTRGTILKGGAALAAATAALAMAAPVFAQDDYRYGYAQDPGHSGYLRGFETPVYNAYERPQSPGGYHVDPLDYYRFGYTDAPNVRRPYEPRYRPGRNLGGGASGRYQAGGYYDLRPGELPYRRGDDVSGAWWMTRSDVPAGAGLEAKVDHDGDGFVDQDEATYLASVRFNMLDADNDDRVNREEFMQADRGLTVAFWNRDPEYENIRKKVEERFSKLDGPDQDGIITRAEFIERTRSVFQTADADDDGKVDVWEYRSVRMPG